MESFFASAGHAALIDHPTTTGLQEIAEDIWANGGVVSAVCHGPAIFANIKDKATGKPIIAGRTISGITNEGEDVLKIMSEIKSWGKPLVEEHAAALGATYKRPDNFWADLHIVDGRVVTGTSPASATSTAKAAVEVYNSL
ncbi:class I glutamine amidotransferase-like protein [Trichoderma compactum]